MLRGGLQQTFTRTARPFPQQPATLILKPETRPRREVEDVMTPRRGFEHDPGSEPASSEYPTASGPDPREIDDQHARHDPGSGHGGHRLMMLSCCLPMLVIAVALAATGIAGSGIVVAALLCTAMMAAMMLAMPGGHGHR